MTPQHLQALELANEIRLERADLRRAVIAGEIHIAEILAYPPESLRTLTVTRILSWPSHMTIRKAERLLNRMGIPISAPLMALSEQRRFALIDELAARHPAIWRRFEGER